MTKLAWTAAATSGTGATDPENGLAELRNRDAGHRKRVTRDTAMRVVRGGLVSAGPAECAHVTTREDRYAMTRARLLMKRAYLAWLVFGGAQFLDRALLSDCLDLEAGDVPHIPHGWPWGRS